MAILGATGKLGERLAQRALEAGYEVSALVREPRKVTRYNERFAAFEGDAFTGEGLDAALSDCSYVVSAIGSRQPIMQRCMTNLVQRLDPRRLRAMVFVSWVGVGAPGRGRGRAAAKRAAVGDRAAGEPDRRPVRRARDRGRPGALFARRLARGLRGLRRGGAAAARMDQPRDCRRRERWVIRTRT
jgi:hypothetical protein